MYIIIIVTSDHVFVIFININNNMPLETKLVCNRMYIIVYITV